MHIIYNVNVNYIMVKYDVQPKDVSWDICRYYKNIKTDDDITHCTLLYSDV